MPRGRELTVEELTRISAANAGLVVISMPRNFRERNFTGESFWARGYFVSTAGLDEEMVRNYICAQKWTGSSRTADG